MALFPLSLPLSLHSPPSLSPLPSLLSNRGSNILCWHPVIPRLCETHAPAETKGLWKGIRCKLRITLCYYWHQAIMVYTGLSSATAPFSLFCLFLLTCDVLLVFCPPPLPSMHCPRTYAGRQSASPIPHTLLGATTSKTDSTIYSLVRAFGAVSERQCITTGRVARRGLGWDWQLTCASACCT